MSKKILDHYIVLKKYINGKDYIKINELKDFCIKKDEVNLKLELEYKLQVYRDYEKSINDINEFFYYINDNLIGYLGIASFGGNIGEINGTVHPDWRREGIFTKLCDLAIAECKRRDFSKILLLCDDKSDSAVEFIKTTGAVYAFSECGMKFNGFSLSQNMGNDIRLRKASNADIKEIERQNAIYFGVSSSEAILPEEGEKNGAITYMVELGEKVIGKIKVDRDQNAAFISGFGIVPEFRSRGYGRQTLSKILSMLNEEEVYDVALDVAVENEKALNLYKRCGFKAQSIMNYYEVK